MRGRTAVLIVVASAIVAALLAGCTTAGAGTTKLTAGDAGKTVTIAPGSTLVVELESNPTTGYDWYVKGAVPSQLTTVAEEYRSEASPGTVGGGGVKTFTFEGADAGSGTLTLVYVRPWESRAVPEQSFSVTVVVKD